MTYFHSTFSSPPSLGVQLRQETPGVHGHLPVHVRADFITFCLWKALKSLMGPECNLCSSAIPSAHVLLLTGWRWRNFEKRSLSHSFSPCTYWSSSVLCFDQRRVAFLSRIPFHQVFWLHPETCLAGEEVEISRQHPGAESEVESQALKNEKKIKCRIQKDRTVIG